MHGPVKHAASAALLALAVVMLASALLVPRTPRAALEPLPTLRIDLNAASAAELESLPRIGPALARRIIEDRAEHGPFASLDDLDRVKGIGKRTIELLRPFARVEPANGR